VSKYEPFDGWKGLHENLAHLFTLKIAACEDECTHSRFQNGGAFKLSITDSVILCQNNPSPLPHFSEPIFVSFIWGKMVIMNLYFNTCLTKCSRDFSLAQGSVKEENGRLTPLGLVARNGSPLRFRTVGGHNRLLSHPLILRPCSAQQ